jgi:hypothetical protein
VVFDRVRRWPPAIATGGTTHELAGSVSATSSMSGAIRTTRTLSSQMCAATSFASASLSVQASEPACVPSLSSWRPWRKAVLCNGACPDGFKLGTVLTRGWFWVRRGGCTTVYRGPTIDQVDFGHPAHVAETDATEISLPAHLVPLAGSEYCYVVRRFNGHGDQEHTTGAAIMVRMSDDGKLADRVPNSVSGLHGMQVSGGRVRLEWFYCPLDQQAEPVRFNIYVGDAGSQFDFEAPLATAAYRGARSYHYLTNVLPEGTHHFVVRAEGANGIENDSGQVLSCLVRIGGPDSITILAAEATLQ